MNSLNFWTFFGIFSLCLLISGCRKTDMEVSPGPRPEFSVTTRVIQPGDSVIFTNLSKGDIEYYSWSFEGAQTTFSDKKDPPAIKYSKPGRFKVSLTASGPNGANTIEKTEFIIVNALDFKVEWKPDSGSYNQMFIRGKILGFRNTTLYRNIALVYENNDPNPGLYSNGRYIYPNSKGEFSESISTSLGDIYYRLIAISIDNDVFLSEVRQISFPKPIFVIEKFEKIGIGLRLKGRIENTSANPYINLISSIFPLIPAISNGSYQSIQNTNGVFDQLIYPYQTIFKTNYQLICSSLSGALGKSDIYTFTVPESFENYTFDTYNYWGSVDFQRVNDYPKTGSYCLASPYFSGNSWGNYKEGGFSGNFPNAGNLVFSVAQSNLSPTTKVEFYLDGVPQTLMGLSGNYKEFSIPVSQGSHYIKWRITKFTTDDYDGRFFLDDISFLE